MIKSRWNLSFNGLVLLDHGDWMGESPTMPLSGSVQEARFIGSSWAKTFGRGNKLRTFTWSRVLEFSTVAERITISSCDAIELELNPTWLMLNFEAQGGKDRIVNRAGLGGLGWEDITQNWEDIGTLWPDPITL